MKSILLGNHTKENVKLVLVKSGRKILKEIEFWENENWEKTKLDFKEAGKKLYNGKNYRLEDFKVNGKILTIFLSEISFKTRVNLINNHNIIKKKGDRYLNNGISIGGLIKTKDDHYLFGYSKNSYPKMQDTKLIGGIVENLDFKNSSSLFLANIKEIKEETSISEESIENITLKGIIDTELGGKIFVTETNLSINLPDVRINFPKREDKELDKLITIKKSDLKSFLLKEKNYLNKLVKIFKL